MPRLNPTTEGTHSTTDLCYPEDADYARRLEAAGVACQVHVEPGMYHAADVFLDDKAPSMTRFRGEMVRVLALVRRPARWR